MNIEPVKNALAAAAKNGQAPIQEEIELILSPGAGVYDGRYANNGWLNELPDPVTKATGSIPFFLAYTTRRKWDLKMETWQPSRRDPEASKRRCSFSPAKPPALRDSRWDTGGGQATLRWVSEPTGIL